jgi:hypothetical protein
VGVGFGGMGAYGMPRIHVNTGDYHPNKLVNAVIKGEGYAKPRMFGLVMFALAIAFNIVNFVLIFVLHLYYPYLYMLSGPLGWAGLWMIITGAPRATTDGSKAALWGRIGLAACLAVGFLTGAYLSFAAHFGD